MAKKVDNILCSTTYVTVPHGTWAFVPNTHQIAIVLMIYKENHENQRNGGAASAE